MRAPNRDLLVLVKDEFLTASSMELELEKINQLLISFETPINLCQAHEVFDMNRYKRITNLVKIQKIMNERELKPFVFAVNKN